MTETKRLTDREKYDQLRKKTNMERITCDLSKTKILEIQENENIQNASILENIVTGNQFLVTDEWQMATNNELELIRKIRDKLQTRRTIIYHNAKTGLEEKIETNEYVCIKEIKGEVLAKEAGELSIEERVMQEVGMSLDEIKKLVPKEDRSKLLEHTKELGIKNAHAIKT